MSGCVHGSFFHLTIGFVASNRSELTSYIATVIINHVLHFYNVVSIATVVSNCCRRCIIRQFVLFKKLIPFKNFKINNAATLYNIFRELRNIW